MLIHQENENIENPHVAAAARARVTPQELARAAAALEAKREAERQQQQDTIALGEAVQQLGMNITAEELLAEVEAARLAQTTSQAAGNKVPNASYLLTDRQARAIGIASIGGLIIPFLIPALFASPRKPSSTLAMMPLAQVANGQTVHCDSLTLSRLASGTAAPEKMMVDARSEEGDGPASAAAFSKEWTLIKTGSAYRVRAWATADQILKCSNEQSAVVFSNRPPWLPAATLMTVDLPLYCFQPLHRDVISDSTFPIFDSKGVEVGEAAGVVQEYVAHGVDDMVDGAIKEHGDELSSPVLSPYYHVAVTVTNGNVHLTGTVSDEPTKLEASRRAEACLSRLGLADRVSNEITIAKS